MRRFNPPPNWPPPPPGWVPVDGWQPDPAWGPAPVGWPLWIDDNPALPAIRQQAFAKQALVLRSVQLPWWIDVKDRATRLGYWLTRRKDGVAPRYQGPEPLRGIENDTELRVMPISRFRWPVLNVSELEWLTRTGKSQSAILSHGLPTWRNSYQVAIWAGDVPSLVGYLPSGQSKRVASAFQEAGVYSIFGELITNQEKIVIKVPGLADPVFAPIRPPTQLLMASSVQLWQRTIQVRGEVERIKLETTGYEPELKATWFTEGLAHPSVREAVRLNVRLVPLPASDEVAVVAESGVILSNFTHPELAEQVRRLDGNDLTMVTRAQLSATDSGFNLKWELRVEIPKNAAETSADV